MRRAACLLLALAAMLLPSSARAVERCAPEGGFHAICGPVGTEDLVDIRGTRWLIGSGLNLGKPAHLVLIDSRRKRYSLLDIARAPERVSGSDCAAPPDPARMSTSGLATRERDGERLLFAVNHGDRRAVEIFRIEQAGTRPRLLWIGCALLPPHTMPNAVVSLPDGKLVVSSFYDPDDPDAWARMDRGEDVGRLLEWTPGKGFRALDIPSLSGPNGLELSADGATLFISAWASRKIIILDRTTGARREIPLDFMPDNLRNLPDGRLLVAGQRTTPASIFTCHSAQCPQPWVIAIVHAQTLVTQPGTASLNYACTALLKDGMLFVTARGAHRILYRNWRFTR